MLRREARRVAADHDPHRVGRRRPGGGVRLPRVPGQPLLVRAESQRRLTAGIGELGEGTSGRGGQNMATIRLTVAQAVVRFLANQYSERDGVRAAADPRLFRHLRSRQRGRRRAGAAGGAGDRRGRPALLPGPQRAGHGARRGRLRPDAQPAAGDGLHRLDRARARRNMLTGAALATTNRIPVLLLPSDIFATRVASPVLQELEEPCGYDVSVNDAFRPLSRFFDRVWRPGAAAGGAAGRDAGAHRPGGDRCGDDRAAAGRAGRGVRLARGAVRASGSGTSPARCPSRPRWPGRSR